MSGRLTIWTWAATLCVPGLFAQVLAQADGKPAAASSRVAAGTDAVDYYVMVCAESADEVYKIRFDGRDQAEVVAKIPVGYQPTEIEGPHGLTIGPDGKFWYLAMAHGKPFGTLYKYEIETDELVGETELGMFPATMQISPATGLLYCVNFNLHGRMLPSSVSIVDPEAMVEVGRTPTGPMPHGSRLSPDGSKHYSCAMMSGHLFEIDAVSFEVVRNLQLDDAPIEGHSSAAKPTWVQPHPTQPRAFVCLNGDNEIVEVNTESWTIGRRFKTAKGPYNLDITPAGDKLLVSYKTAGQIGIWDLETGQELAKFKSTRQVTHGAVISPDGRFGFVSSEGIGSDPGAVDVVDLKSHQIVATVAVGLQAGGIAFWKTAAQR